MKSVESDVGNYAMIFVRECKGAHCKKKSFSKLTDLVFNAFKRALLILLRF